MNRVIDGKTIKMKVMAKESELINPNPTFFVSPTNAPYKVSSLIILTFLIVIT